MSKDDVAFLHEQKLRKERDFYKNILNQCIDIYNEYMLDDTYDTTDAFNKIGELLRQSKKHE